MKTNFYSIFRYFYLTHLSTSRFSALSEIHECSHLNVMINEVNGRVESMKLKNYKQPDIKTFWNNILLQLLILFTGLIVKEFHIFIYGATFVKQITSRKLIFRRTNFLRRKWFQIFRGKIKFHEFCELRFLN